MHGFDPSFIPRGRQMIFLRSRATRFDWRSKPCGMVLLSSLASASLLTLRASGFEDFSKRYSKAPIGNIRCVWAHSALLSALLCLLCGHLCAPCSLTRAIFPSTRTFSPNYTVPPPTFIFCVLTRANLVAKVIFHGTLARFILYGSLLQLRVLTQ